VVPAAWAEDAEVKKPLSIEKLADITITRNSRMTNTPMRRLMEAWARDVVRKPPIKPSFFGSNELINYISQGGIKQICTR
jgi:hypothetical protein